jgi:hypothetical protein
MQLSDTVELMLSNDWKDRLKAEYWQTRIRVEKLNDYLDSDEIMESPDGGMDLLLLTTQRDIMYSYLTSLYNRIITLDLDKYVDDISDMNTF